MPPTAAGRNFHPATASSTAPSSIAPADSTMATSMTLPFSSIQMSTTGDPSMPLSSAAGGYSGILPERREGGTTWGPKLTNWPVRSGSLAARARGREKLSTLSGCSRFTSISAEMGSRPSFSTRRTWRPKLTSTPATGVAPSGLPW